MKTLSALKIHISKILAQKKSPLKMLIWLQGILHEMHAVLQSLEVQMSKAAFSRKLAEAKLHVQIYLSESFAVAVCSAAIEVSASTLLEFISKDASVGSVPVFDTYFGLKGEVTYMLEGVAVELYVLLVAVENHFFHSFRASGFRTPWRKKISNP